MSSTKKAMALASTAVLVGAGALAIPSALASESADAALTPMEVDVACCADEGCLTEAKSVEGCFSFDQNAVSSNDSIATMFIRAATSVCAAMPQYGVTSAGDIVVSADGASAVVSVADAAEEGGADVRIMGCACSSNVAGGGAIANAEVSGVTLEAMAQMVNAR